MLALATFLALQTAEELQSTLTELGHASIDVRDRAMRRLAAWGEPVRPDLAAIDRDPAADADARMRARLIMRFFDLVADAPPMFCEERRTYLAPLAVQDWETAWRDLTTLVYDEGLQPGGTPAETLTHERGSQIEWYLQRLIQSRATPAIKARAAVALSRLGRPECLAPYADVLVDWIHDAGDSEIPILQELMERFDQDTTDPKLLWNLREHPRLLLQVNVASWLRRRPEALDTLMALLHYPRTGTRDAAAYLLAQGEVYEAAPAVAALLKAMAPEGSSQLIATAAALNAVEAIPAMLEILNDGRASYVDDIGAALITLGAEDYVGPLTTMLQTASPSGAIEIIRVLRIMGARDSADAIAPLALKGSNPLRLTAVQALAVMDSEKYSREIGASLTSLVSEGYAPAIRYQTERDEVAAVAIRPMEEPPPPPPIPDIGRAWEVPRARLDLAAERAATRLEAVRVIQRHLAIDAAGDVARLLRDPDGNVRLAAVRTLGQIAAECVAEEADALTRDASVEVRRETARVLSRLFEGIPWLRRMLHDSEFDVRLASAEGLAALGDDLGLDFLKEQLQHPAGRRWAETAEALARLQRHAFIPMLLTMLDDTRDRWAPSIVTARPALLRSAARMMEPGRGHELIKYLDDPDLVVRKAAVEEMFRLGGDGIAPALAALLAHRQSTLRESAITGLSHLPTDDVVVCVPPYLKDQLPFVREAAVRVLRAHEHPVAARHVAEAEHDPSTRVRAAAKD